VTAIDAGTDLLLREIEQFVFREARLADDHSYDEWEALWTDDGQYWVPAGSDRQDQIAIIDDNRSRIALRVAQLNTGKRHSQAPPSSVRKVLSNIELLDTAGDELSVGANFLAVEARNGDVTLWGGRVSYGLRRIDGTLRMARKKVSLVNRDQPLRTLAFLI
jgi:3-phenylpropionate/cinnamic acid dioxygenase small subunit